MNKNEQVEPENAAQTQEKPKRRAQSAALLPKEPIRIYLGPNLPGGRLTTATTFRGGIPPHLSDLLESRPEVGLLIFPVSEMADAQSKIRTSGMPEYQAYQTLLKSGKGQ